MTNSPHRIRRLHWTVTTDTAPAAFALRQQLRNEWEAELLPLLERAFDQAVDGDRILHLPKLELHIQATPETLWDALPEQIQEQWSEVLRSHPQGTTTSVSTGDPVFTVLAEGPSAQSTSLSQTWLERLLVYIRTGSLPWDIVDLPAEEIAAALQNIWHEQRSSLMQALDAESLETPNIFRLLQLVPVEDRPALVQDLLASLNVAWAGTVAEVLTRWLVFQHPQLGDHWRLSVTATYLATSLASNRPDRPPSFEETTARLPALTEGICILLAFLAALPQETAFAPLMPSDTAGDSVQGPSPRPPVHWQDQPTADDSRNLDTAPLTPEDAPSDPFSSPADNDLIAAYLRTPQVSADIAPESPMRVHFAGLVLLHGFIPHFFEQCGLTLTDQRTLSPADHPRAAALLHHLATGTLDIYEYELDLIKLLLGLDLQTPLAVAGGLVTPADQQEAVTLLQSAIGYWSILGNTSEDGLRTSFLRRQGLLYPVEQGWCLRVEGRPFDMLLNHLPWSISLIKLPWMPYPLYTEWPLP
jgi:hypothetical protein